MRTGVPRRQIIRCTAASVGNDNVDAAGVVEELSGIPLHGGAVSDIKDGRHDRRTPRYALCAYLGQQGLPTSN